MNYRDEPNGKLKLSFAQIAWGISVIAIMLATWYDARNQLNLAVATLEGRLNSLENIVNRDNDESRDELADLRVRITELERKAHK